MRSLVVVFPESMCAMMPMLRMRDGSMKGEHRSGDGGGLQRYTRRRMRLAPLALLLAIGGCRPAREHSAQRASPVKPVSVTSRDHPGVPPPATESRRPEPRTADPRTDPSRPLLSDERMRNLIASMKEGPNPLLAPFAESGAMLDPETQRARRTEFDAFAQRYAFHDHEDYLYAWGRVEGIRIVRRAAAPAIRELEAKGSLTASDEEQLERLRHPADYNANDVALVAKYDAAYTEASQHYRKGK